MIQIYYGDGKGKTTAAIGLAVRAVGHEIPVIFTQFLKSDTSGEISVLRAIDGINVIYPDCFYGFVSNMSNEQKERTRESYNKLINEIAQKIECILANAADSGITEEDNRDVEMVVVLDEVLHAVNFGLLDEEKLLRLLKNYRDRAEIVLTGRNPMDRLLELADYVSEISKQKHPYDRGLCARKGIEQ